MEKVKKGLFLFLVWLAVILLAYTIILAIFIRSPKSLGIPGYIMTVLSFLPAAAGLVAYRLLGNKGLRISKAAYIICVIALTAVPRLIWVALVPTEPFSDFLHFHNYAINASKGQFREYFEQFTVFPFKFSYGLIVALIYRIFGVSLSAVRYSNVFLSVILVLLIYAVGRKVFDEETARLAGILFALWPSQIMFTSVMASEHVFMVFFMAALLLFFKILDNTDKRRVYVLALLTGICLMVAQVVRPMATLLFVVFIIYLAFFVETGEKPVKGMIKKASVFAVIAAGFMISLLLVNAVVYRLTGVPIWRASSGYNLMIGTNFESSGTFNNEDYELVKEYDYDYDRVHAEGFRIAIERIKSQPFRFLKLVEDKFEIQWASEEYGYIWSTRSIEDESASGSQAASHPRFFIGISQIYYIGLLAFAIAGCIIANRKGIFALVPLLLVYEGMVAAYTFLEVQPRYHYPVVPLFLIVAAYGIKEGHLIIYDKQRHCEVEEQY
jgi:4-amino-4-deoxy-L-arabinose transferase-like glycosyltransferase